MGKRFLTFATTVILQAVANGYRYGFDIIDITGLPAYRVSALRRLEEGHLDAEWEEARIAQDEPRAPAPLRPRATAERHSQTRQAIPARGHRPGEESASETVAGVEARACPSSPT